MADGAAINSLSDTDLRLHLPGPTLTVLKCARSDRRILEAYQLLESKLVDGRVVVQRVVPKLANLNFCMKGEPSKHATKIFHAIQANLLL
jgi:hypothetical protein